VVALSEATREGYSPQPDDDLDVRFASLISVTPW